MSPRRRIRSSMHLSPEVAGRLPTSGSMRWCHQFDEELGPVTAAVLRGKAATELADDVTRNRKPQAQALAGRLGGEKRFEKLLMRNLWQSGPRVGDTDDDAPATRLAPFDGERGLRRISHCIDGVTDQVNEHLLQPIGL